MLRLGMVVGRGPAENAQWRSGVFDHPKIRSPSKRLLSYERGPVLVADDQGLRESSDTFSLVGDLGERVVRPWRRLRHGAIMGKMAATISAVTLCIGCHLVR